MQERNHDTQKNGMPRMIYHAKKDDVLDRISIFDVLDLFGLRYERKGDTYVCECPFHEERLGKPDMHIGNCTVYPAENICHCFSCGGHGNTISIVKSRTGYSFCNSIDYLAKQLAPDLLSADLQLNGFGNGSWPRKRCPLSRQELELLDLQTSEVRSMTGFAHSRDDTTRPREYIAKDVFAHSEDDPGPVFVKMTRSPYTLENLYNDDAECFYMIVSERIKSKLEALEKLYQAEQLIADPMMRNQMRNDTYQLKSRLEDIELKLEEAYAQEGSVQAG